MERLFSGILKHRRWVIAAYLVLAVMAAMAAQRVRVDSNLANYLPADSASTVSLDVMVQEFGGEIPNCELMVKDITAGDAIALEDRLRAIDGVKAVTGLGDRASALIPFDMISEDLVKPYYRDGHALYYLTLDEEKDSRLLDEIRQTAGGNCALAGSNVNAKILLATSSREIGVTVAVAILFAVVILSLTMDSWAETFALLGCLGVAILINSGTNLLFGTVSSVTRTAASVLQLGVSADYSIFLLHRYKENKRGEGDPQRAMASAMTTSLASVASSALTTVVGFFALVFMRYRIGQDMGLVMAKGVFISLIVVFTLYPCVLLSLRRLSARTAHRELVTGVGRLPEIIRSWRWPTVLAFAALAVVCLLVQGNNQFYYGSSHQFKDDSQVAQERQSIEAVFGRTNTMVLLVPEGEAARESQLYDALRAMPDVESVTARVGILGYGVPSSMVPDALISQLESGKYSRYVLTLSCDDESEATFARIDQIKGAAAKYYDNFYLAGNSVSTYDLKTVISADNLKVNAIAVAAIFVILLLTFQSLAIAAILVLTIEGAIWINMGIPYFMGVHLFYIGYLIVSSVLIGATVDYAILLTSRYIEFRGTLDKGAARREAIAKSALSIMTSATILAAAGILLGLFCTNQLIGQLGTLLARGTLLAAVIVLFVLPNLLCWCDTLFMARKLGRMKGKDGPGD